MNITRNFLSLCLITAFFITSFFSVSTKAQAHEVYVLNQNEIANGLSQPFHNPLDTIAANKVQFIQWGFLIAGIILLSLAFSLSPKIIVYFSSAMLKMKKYAPFLGRLTLGASLFASGYFGGVFGPELKLSVLNPDVRVVSILFMLMGVMILLGLATRLAALVALIVFALTVYDFHGYMLTYANYLGEIILCFIFGGGLFSIDRFLPQTVFDRIGTAFEMYGFVILRILYGVAIFFASFYAKFLHSSLALDTVFDYHLTNYFPFTPDFLVLGAFIVEALIGLCFIFGIQIRFAAIIFTGFLILSITFFGEAVWPHLILFGVNIVLFLRGYDKFTLGYYLVKGKTNEPVL